MSRTRTTRNSSLAVFHEVRVPLNGALLSFQNLDEEGAFRHLSEDQQDMVLGLHSTLNMMEKVLNDVLSFNRMESGTLIQARKPFAFHKYIQIVVFSQKPKSDQLELKLHLDPRVDEVCGGIFIGDEMRLRQIVSNLVSNAIKFTERGSIHIRTALVYPCLPSAADSDAPILDHMDSKRSIAKQDSVGQQPYTRAVIRVEVADSGVGLTYADVRDNRLFSPYVQTEIGRRQGGKGSGLGLALVMQIVKLSGGRLGVESELGKGSTFW